MPIYDTNLNQQILSMFWVLHWPPISLPLLDKVKVLVTQSCPTLCNPMNCSLPGSSVMEFFRQEYWSGLPFPSPGDLPNPGIEPRSPALQADSLLWATREAPPSPWVSLFPETHNNEIRPINNPTMTNECSSERMDWLDLPAVQGTLKSLLQHHSSKASISRHSAFFTVQLSHPYMTTGKTIALTRQTFVGKVISLLFNMLSRLVITFLPRSKHLLISWLQSPSAVILEPPKIKSDTVSTVSPSISHEVMGPDAMILVFWMLSFKSTFSLSSFTFIKRIFSSSSLSAIRVCVICISEVIDISPGNLDSSLCFFQPSVSHDVLCI